MGETKSACRRREPGMPGAATSAKVTVQVTTTRTVAGSPGAVLKPEVMQAFAWLARTIGVEVLLVVHASDIPAHLWQQIAVPDLRIFRELPEAIAGYGWDIVVLCLHGGASFVV
jgi:hypothetical protein